MGHYDECREDVHEESPRDSKAWDLTCCPETQKQRTLQNIKETEHTEMLDSIEKILDAYEKRLSEIEKTLDASEKSSIPPKKANDTQVGGTHYKLLKYETWDVIASWGLGYLDGNAVKYISRWRNKNGIEDLKKARHYLDKLIEEEEKKSSEPDSRYTNQD